ncbi:MAG: hypothetical protein GY804_11190 [Alphaproteobacteria bacterium]|nr:hypothetical protein [Alphaproteobacteria bacterium]
MTTYTFKSRYPEIAPSAEELAAKKDEFSIRLMKAAATCSLMSLASGIASVAFFANGHAGEGFVSGLFAVATGDLAIGSLEGINTLGNAKNGR